MPVLTSNTHIDLLLHDFRSRAPCPPPTITGQPMQQPTPESNKPILNYKFEGDEDHVWSIVISHHTIHIVSSSYDSTMRK